MNIQVMNPWMQLKSNNIIHYFIFWYFNYILMPILLYLSAILNAGGFLLQEKFWVLPPPLGLSLPAPPPPPPPAPCTLPLSVDITARRGLNPVGRHAALRESDTPNFVTPLLLHRRSSPNAPGHRGKPPHGELRHLLSRRRRVEAAESSVGTLFLLQIQLFQPVPCWSYSCVLSRTSSSAALVALQSGETLTHEIWKKYRVNLPPFCALSRSNCA